ncbi:MULTISPECIES: hypothetical protein [unclassified Streptomyces]|uniref:hypothetical protein n=1 Tax=unclassified Streptomyces TaxID=2593676 RepID=UPI0029AA3D8F|nr:hypothetical protein [Streptomyces sp. FL07-04A]MDX3578461.1 hypothetical protein [Streptomyces sp. FL07-04A]
MRETDPSTEADKGRVPLWLDPDDLRWLAEHCCCPADASDEEKDRCGRLRFRAGAALQQHGQSR